jgi:hypothetical protein
MNYLWAVTVQLDKVGTKRRDPVFCHIQTI